MDNNNNNYWYNVKQVNGKTVIEKIDSNGQVIDKSEPQESVENTPTPMAPNNRSGYVPPRNVDRPLSSLNGGSVPPVYQNYQGKKKSKIGLFLVLAVFIIAIAVGIIFIAKKEYRNANMKNRTFMIYMVGSDLESENSMATFDLQDVEKANVDFENTNVVLMVGGSKKWHNYVQTDEIGIYELTKDGFKKKKSLPVDSMGTISSLETFLDYSYDNYPAEKYDLLFWNHGMGALGLELDEIKNDFLDINELSRAFKNSPFAKEKLEVVIFNNCLAGNYHFANIMSNYAEYMVGSEEIMYVAKIIDRLNFIEDIKVSDNGYDIGKLYVDQSDKSMNKINSYGVRKYDTTMSIIDLSNIDNLDKKINEFFKSVDLNNNYSSIARARMKTHTYSGEVQYVYDTVDLYELVDALTPYTTNKSAADNLKKEIKNTVMYNTSNNNYSNGISIYFPYYGNTEYVETHMYLFDTLWKNDYTKFISNFYDSNKSTKRARRAITGSEINKLSGNVNVNGNYISIELNGEEMDNFQRANVYVFDKNDNKYELLLKSNNVNLEDGRLTYNHYGLLKSESHYLTLIDEGNYKVYETLEGKNLITDIKIENGKINLVSSRVDSGKTPSGGIYEERTETKTSLYLLNYNLFDQDEINPEWDDTLEREVIEIENIDDLVIDESLNGHYVLIEMYDINNDVFYSELKEIR